MVRRALKTPPAVIEPGAAEAFRNRVKAVELEAERLQQQAMYDLAATLPFAAAASPAQAAQQNVAAYQAICPAPFPPSAIEAILTALARQS
jgi:hypothetical protein